MVEESHEGSPGAVPEGDWDEIERQLTEFGQRMADMVRTAVDDPDTRRHAREVKSRLEQMAGRIGDAVESAASSPEATRLREAGKQAAADAAPHVASALRVANEMLQGVVDKLEERAADLSGRADAAGPTDAADAAATDAQAAGHDPEDAGEG